MSGEAFYHVTRYGVRENTFMSTGGGHTVGEGEFLDNLTPLLKDGYIKDCTTTGKHIQLCILGDHQQNIFQFNNADNRFLLLADKIFPHSTVVIKWKVL